MNSPSGTVAVPGTHIIESLAIHNYRCFDHYTVGELGRVNLLVGMNNSGKTSILEAIQILATGGDPYTLVSIMKRRGEYLPAVYDSDGGIRRELDLRHLFYGYEIALGTAFRIETNLEHAAWVSATLSSRKEIKLFYDGSEPSSAILEIQSSVLSAELVTPVSRRGGLSTERAEGVRSPFMPRMYRGDVQFIAATSVTAEYVALNWPSIALSPEEELVVEALRILDPEIDRIAVIGGDHEHLNGRGGVVVKRRGSDRPVAIGSMGDGLWRMLGLAIALIRSRDGILLVDDIDAGLHYTVMADMWKLIALTAKRLNIQVFATTHSANCVDSLADICRSDVRAGSDVTLHRIDRKFDKAIAFTEREITIAATREIEVR